MEIICRHCQHPVPSANINIQTSMAKCAECGEVFSLLNQIPTASVIPPKPSVGIPRKIRLDREYAEMTITYIWFSERHIGTLVFSIIWMTFLYSFYKDMVESHAAWPTFLIPIIHVTVGFVLLYFSLAGFFSRTRIYVNDQWVTIRHYPLPWPGKKIVATAQIAQIYCTNQLPRNKFWAYKDNINFYHVYLLTKDGSRQLLLSRLETLEQAVFIEQQIEGFLGIPDQPVYGEIGPM